jgi:hypothetical protein
MRSIVKISILLIAGVLHTLLSADIMGGETVGVIGNYKSRIFLSRSSLQQRERSISSMLWLNSARLKGWYRPSDQHFFEADYEVVMSYYRLQELVSSDLIALPAFKYRYKDFKSRVGEHTLSPNHLARVEHNLDRFFYTWSKEQFDLAIGRQPVSLGSARLVNPTDVFVPYSLTATDKEDRAGVDAARLKLPVGEMGEVDFGYLLGKNGKLDQSAAFLKVLQPFGNWEFAPVVVRFRKHKLLGIDIQGQIMGAGAWFESAYVDPEVGNGYARLSLGSDYNFGDNLYGFIEYHFNGAGTRAAAEYLSNTINVAYQEGGVYLMGRDYLSFGVNYQISELFSFSQNVTHNLTDHSALLSPHVGWNFIEDHYFDLGLFWGIGRRSNSSFLVRSEFGSYARTIYANYRAYF